MAEPTVWTERLAGQLRFTLCTWASLEMVCVGAGNTKWPKGVYTDAELLAFVGGSTTLNFSGGVTAAKARYGITIHSPTPMTQAQLKAALNIPNRVYAVAGKLANFPAGHRLRRWAPTFTGFHAIAVVTHGNDSVTWLDPMAPMGFAGDGAHVAEVADIFALGNYPNDARYMALNEVGGDMTITITTYTGQRDCATKGGVLVGYRLNPAPLTKSGTFAAGSGFHSDAEYTCSPTPAGWPPGPYQRVVDGFYAGYLVANGQISLGPVPAAGGFTQADIDKAVAANDAAWEKAKPNWKKAP